MGRSTVSAVIAMTCKALWDCLSATYVKCLSTPAEWLKVARDFDVLWNFPQLYLAIDGKHVITECPPNSGSARYNYKDTFSTVRMYFQLFPQ